MIDTSLWKVDTKSQAAGTREKFWLFEPGKDTDSAIRHLFKVPTENTGGHWAEYVASKLGNELGFNLAEVKLAINNDKFGTISKNFREDTTEEFYEGGDLFVARFEEFDRFSLKYYELPNIMEILSTYQISNKFIDIPLFDALIANNDRHCDNWGVLSGEKGIRLAPIYDNGSSLGFNEVSAKKEKMLTDDEMMLGFCNRGKSSIGMPNHRKPKHFVLLSFLNEHFSKELSLSMARLNKLNESLIKKILEDIPHDIMSHLDKKWIIRLLIYRKKWI